MTKINWKGFLIFLVLIGSVVWAGKGIFKYNVFSTHDLDHHLARSFDAVQTIKEGHFPLRWAGSLNYRCGVPIYNFFYPLYYYLIVLVNSLHPDIILALKIIDFLSLLIGTLFFFLWMKEETKKDIPALGGALLYLYAPYRFSLIFVRGSPEFLAYAILPVVLYFYALFFNSSGRRAVMFAFLASLTGALLAISHNFTVMFVFPLILAYLIVKFILLKSAWRQVGWAIFSFLGSFGMASFFIGPALLEQKFTRIGENFLFWKDHFPTLGQLFKSPWGYFYSSSGTANDGMSFMLGYAQWVVLGIGALWIVYRLIHKKFDTWVILTFLASLVTIYLILPWSIPVWEKLPPLQEIQFSWRLLGIAIFTISALFSFILDKINTKYLLVPIFAGVVLLGFYGNRNHLLPQPISVQDLYRYDDFEKYHYHRYSTTTLGDDIIAKGAAGACWFDVPPITTDKEVVEYSIVERGNTYGSIKFDLPKNPKGQKLMMGLGYFPGAYTFEINGSEVAYADCGGRVCIDTKSIRAGPNFISWTVGQTPTQAFFNKLALAFLLLWLALLFRGKATKFSAVTVVILILFVFFRSYNLPGRVGFGWDQERDAQAITSILAGKLTLLGPRVQGPAGFFLPPYFFYLLAPFYFLTGLNPNATVLFIVAFGFVFFLTTLFVIGKIFNRNLGLYFLALWAVNPLAVSIDTIAWNPLVIPLLFLVFIFSIYKSIIKPTRLWLLLAGVIFGLGVSFHLQFLFTFPLISPLAYDLYKKGKLALLSYLVPGPLLAFLPLILFDLRHGFLNAKQLIEFATHSESQVNRLLNVWGNVAGFISGFPSSVLVGITLFCLVIAGLGYLWKQTAIRAKRKMIVGLGLVWATSLPMFFLLIKNPSEYYFNYLLVVFTLVIALILQKLKFVGLLILAGMIITFGYFALPLLKEVHYSLREKDRAVVLLKNITKNSTPFNISFDVPANEDAGFRYLLNYHKVEYSGRAEDPLIEFVIPVNKRPISFQSGRVGFYFPPDWIKSNWLR